MVESRSLAQSIFASYFGLIVCLFWVTLRSLRRMSLKSKPSYAPLFLSLALGSLCHTWFYMIKFLTWSFDDFEARHSASPGRSVVDRVTTWLVGSELFEQAWMEVCKGSMNWWWSEQLCIITVGVWTTFLYVQGSRRRIPHVWAYMILGQLVAISVSSNLFFAAILLSEPVNDKTKTKRTTKIPPRVYIPILLSHLTILLTPAVARPESRWFLPNLLAMHTLIVLPLINIPSPSVPTNSGLTSQTFYLCLAALAVVLRTQTYLSVPLPSSSWAIPELIKTLHSHPAQSSIGYDVLWTTASFGSYCGVAAGSLGQGVLGALSPSLALYLDDRRH